MATCLVTGGAGFLGSHLCDELLRRGHRVICVDNFETGSLANIEHIRAPEFVLLHTDIIEPFFVDEPVDFVYHFASPGVADRLPAAAAAHAQGRLLRHAPRARAGQAAPRALPDRLDVRGLRRPAGPPAARVLLGPREPDRPARRLRRGQALRRGADDGLPPPAGRGHRDRAHLQHLRPADAPARRPRDPDVPAPGAAGPADHRVRRRLPDALVLLRLATWSTASSGSPSPATTSRSTSATRTSSRCSSSPQAVIEVTGSRSEIVHEALPDRRPAGPPAGHLARPRAARLGAAGRAARGPAAHARGVRRRGAHGRRRRARCRKPRDIVRSSPR